MPNHVTCVCDISGSPADIAQIRKCHFKRNNDGDEYIAFETIIEKPACVDATEASSEADAGFYALTGLVPSKFSWTRHPMDRPDFPGNKLSTNSDFLEWLKQTNPDAVTKGQRQLDCFRETGHRSWYEWNIANWGTKWGAYDFCWRSETAERLVFKFETAWSVATPILEKLADMYQETTIEIEAIDEGGPEYAGHYHGIKREFSEMQECDERYKRVYGRERPNYDDEDED